MRLESKGTDSRGVPWQLYEHKGLYFLTDDTHTLALVDGYQAEIDNFDPDTFSGEIIETTEADLAMHGLTKESGRDL